MDNTDKINYTKGNTTIVTATSNNSDSTTYGLSADTNMISTEYDKTIALEKEKVLNNENKI